MMEGERKRAPNFSMNEKTLLLTIMHKFKDVIENKKTNSSTWREKDDAWQKIEEIFNSQTPDTYLRTKDALRKFYDNIKKNVRKDVAEEKKEIFKTGGGLGGGVIRCVPNPVKELALGLMNPKTVIGFPNEFDSDNFVRKEVSFDSNQACVGVPETENSDTDSELCATEQSEHTYAENENSEIIEITEFSHDQSSSFASPSMLASNFNKTADNRSFGQSLKNNSQPLESGVCSGKTKRARSIHIGEPKSECLKSPWLKRRRPAIQQLPSSKLSEEYLSLSKIKIECFQAEKENINSREKREQILFELQKKKLLLEIEVEAQKLKQFKN